MSNCYSFRKYGQIIGFGTGSPLQRAAAPPRDFKNGGKFVGVGQGLALAMDKRIQGMTWSIR